MAGGDIDPHRDELPGAGGPQPELLRPDGHVPGCRDHRSISIASSSD
ncbi:MAG TPA: hypothetical protein VG253_00740 [Streptosporangiaceae bacterium]|nr:hypothetical protein [Streptosporangiaceae bacterium]